MDLKKKKSHSSKSEEYQKSESVLLINYTLAKSRGDTTQIKIHENILKRLGIKIPKD